MDKAKVAHHVNNPEVLVARGRFHDLLRRRQLNQGGELHLGSNGDNVLRVILDRTRRVLCGDSQGTRQEEEDGNTGGEVRAVHDGSFRSGGAFVKGVLVRSWRPPSTG